MKEQYFNHDTLPQKSQELLNYCPQLPNKENKTPDWNISALLVLDMQRFFLESASHAFVPSSPIIVPGIVRLIQSFLDNGLPIYLTRHVNTILYAGMMKKWWNQLILETEELSELIPEIQNIDVPVICKQEYDAFYETNLTELLTSAGIKELIITGVMTHLCVDTTVRSAFVRGFQPYLPVDGTATYNEAFHRATLLNLSHGYAVMTSIDSLIHSLEKDN